jgi:tRNA G18 (ribose-2'-O)-methylase SpoU
MAVIAVFGKNLTVKTLDRIIMAHIIEIHDLSYPGMTLFCRQSEAQLRQTKHPGEGVFLAESPNVARIALEAGCRPVAMLAERKKLDGMVGALVQQMGDIPVYVGDADVLAGITGFHLVRGVICAFRRPRLLSVEEVCRGSHRLAVIDSVVDATNIGTIFRGAAALGMDGVLLTPTTCDPLNRRSVRVSMGTVFQIPWAVLGNSPADWPQQGVAQLHEMGFRLAALALSDTAISLDDARLQQEDRLAVVLGTEGDGLSHSAISACDYVVKIPMQHGVDSLNVAAAAAVAFWQLRK